MVGDVVFRRGILKGKPWVFFHAVHWIFDAPSGHCHRTPRPIVLMNRDICEGILVPKTLPLYVSSMLSECTESPISPRHLLTIRRYSVIDLLPSHARDLLYLACFVEWV